MPEIIDFGSFKIRFLHNKHQTGGALDIFELELSPVGRMPVPHYHETWEETVYGVRGTVTYIVDGQPNAIKPGTTLFIPRGAVHGFDNRTDTTATCLCVLTPGVLGPEYFRDLAELVKKGQPDPGKVRATMLSYGLIPG